MMIRITQSFVNADGPVNHGERFDCPEDKAMELIALNRAVAVAVPPSIRMEHPSRNALAEVRTAITKAVKGARR